MVTQAQNFGDKIAKDRLLTFSEKLLSGKPITRPTRTYTPKLKPRPKAQFGQKNMSNEALLMASQESDSKKWQGRTFWVVISVVLGFAFSSFSYL